MCTNHALRLISDLPSLVSLRVDRTKRVSRKGLAELAHKDSKTRDNLEVLHLGVFKHKNFDKVDVARFFTSMTALKEFSLLGEDRATVKVRKIH